VSFAKRNHYNPCFWTAHWNQDYYRCAVSGTGQTGAARSQRVYALSVKTGEIFESAVEKVHFDKGLGVAEISREASEDFARRYHPDLYEEFVRANAQAPYPVYIDFEEILQGIEALPPYQVLLDVVRRGSIQSPEEKANLGLFVVIQHLRSHAIMNSMIEWQAELERHKFEHFLNLKWLLEDAQAMVGLVGPTVACRWTLFCTASDTFPLCDSPVLVKPQGIMIALSPRMLLEITRSVPAREDEWRMRREIRRGKLAEFRRRTIANTFREIIFGEPSVLEYWQRTPEFRNRVNLMNDVKKYNHIVRTEGSRELWEINAYGNKL
jgi:hypothetical protein